jgi:hypothetical protein
MIIMPSNEFYSWLSKMLISQKNTHCQPLIESDDVGINA